MAAIVFDFLESAAKESVNKAIGDAKRKFESRGWANHAVVALHAGEQQFELSLPTIKETISGMTAEEIRPIDLIFLVEDKHVIANFGGIRASGQSRQRTRNPQIGSAVAQFRSNVQAASAQSESWFPCRDHGER